MPRERKEGMGLVSDGSFGESCMHRGAPWAIRIGSPSIYTSPAAAHTVRELGKTDVGLHRNAEMETDAIAVGSRIEVAGLIKQPELNGKLGIVVDHDQTVGRWKVLLDDGRGKSFHASNLAAIDQVAQLQPSTSPDFTTHAPEPWRSNSPSRRHVSTMVSEKELASTTFACKNSLPLSVGQAVNLFGLRSRTDLNGRLATVVAWDDARGLWQVVLDDGFAIAVHVRHLATAQQPALCGSPDGLSAASPTSREVGASLREHIQVGEVADNGYVQSTGLPVPDSPWVSSPSLGAPRPPGRGQSPSNPGLRSGDLVVVVGLKTRVELNGCCGVVNGWDNVQARWRVHMRDGTCKLYWPANVQRLAWAERTASPIQSPRQASPGTRCSPRVPSLPTSPASAGLVPPVELTPGRSMVAYGLLQNQHQQQRSDVDMQSGTLHELDSYTTRGEVRMGSHAMLNSQAQNVTSAGGLVHRSANSDFGIHSSPGECGGPRRRDEPHLQLGMASPRSPSASSRNGRWRMGRGVRQSSSPEKGPCNAIDAGTPVRLCGLQGRPEMNGMTGVVTGYDSAELRWCVRLQDGSHKLCRQANMQIIAEDRIWKTPTEEESANFPTVASRQLRRPPKEEEEEVADGPAGEGYQVFRSATEDESTRFPADPGRQLLRVAVEGATANFPAAAGHEFPMPAAKESCAPDPAAAGRPFLRPMEEEASASVPPVAGCQLLVPAATADVAQSSSAAGLVDAVPLSPPVAGASLVKADAHVNVCRVAFAAKFDNLNYDDLVKAPTLFAAFQRGVTSAVLAEIGASISREHISLRLAPGSVVAHFDISVPPGASSDLVQSRLATTTMNQRLVDSAKAVPGIVDVASGAIAVSRISIELVYEQVTEPIVKACGAEERRGKAAVKIQAHARGRQARRVQHQRIGDKAEFDRRRAGEDAAAVRIQAQVRGRQARARKGGTRQEPVTLLSRPPVDGREDTSATMKASPQGKQHGCVAFRNDAKPADPVSTEEDGMRLGARVRVVGLSSRPELEGKCGHITSEVIEAYGLRRKVRLDDGSHCLIPVTHLQMQTDECSLSLPTGSKQDVAMNSI